MSFSVRPIDTIYSAFERARADLTSRGAISTALLDALFPPRCGGCSQLSKELFCYGCKPKVQLIAAPFCACCGYPFDSNAYTSDFCAKCRFGKPRFDAARSHQQFQGPMREVIHRLKYRKQFDFGRRLAPLLLELIETDATLKAFGPQLLVPVPLHASRLRSRGFNQSVVLAQELSKLSEIPTCEALVRNRATISQVGLTAQERKRNVGGAFALAGEPVVKQPKSKKPPSPAGRAVNDARILLIDDVFTTGATLNECASVLKKAGASAVIAITLASQRSPQDKDSIDERWTDVVI